MDTDRWNELKKDGSDHYHTLGVQPIDLLKDTVPHASLTALDVKALTDGIKYCHRMLTTGVNPKDCRKVQHYMALIAYCAYEKENKEPA